MNTFLSGPVSWLLAPLALIKGLGVRRLAPRLPPPSGRPRGQVGDGPAQLRLLVLGDSSAAGVGAERIEDTLGPQIAACLNAATGKPVSWRNAGANSAIAAQIRDHVVPNIEDRDYTHVVLAVGTNDAKNFVTRSAFKKGFGGLLYAAHARWPDARIYWSPVVDMNHVPALPASLAYVLGLRAGIINTMGIQLCRERYATAAAPLQIEGPEGFAADGFHANALGYRHWAAHLARFIADAEPAPSSSQKPG
ncbi:SGNH/GDSL hydrolase family protein [Hoeflea ulvae]|uniref:SGNH/GDSL hydrolase family protein n=1 Tax=Hoeflea ulvae TaxID=2983764 RepID=A0ABT3YKU1_9HYPH|nr:SGNH/GDSL hydrolase family protein [Hoeflea ulvae]MCY0096518.1 SGNH/GDSL hydrolase family protein [Hoeflea ulvae]